MRQRTYVNAYSEKYGTVLGLKHHIKEHHKSLHIVRLITNTKILSLHAKSNLRTSATF